jgi:hypothetical protein
VLSNKPLQQTAPRVSALRARLGACFLGARQLSGRVGQPEQREKCLQVTTRLARSDLSLSKGGKLCEPS